MKKRFAWVAAIAAIPLLLAGCSTASTTPTDKNKVDMKIAFITHASPGDTYWDVVKSGEVRAAEDLGIDVTYQSDPDPVKQSGLIDSAVADGVDGIVVSMANPDGLKDSIQKAIAAGIPVISVDSGLERFKEFGLLTHIGQSEYVAGRGVGEKLKAAGVKNAICVIHEAGNTGLEDRCRGIKDTIGSKVQNLQVDINNLADAQNTIKAKMLADPSIDSVVTLGPPLAVAASAALDEAKSMAKLVTFDLSEDVTKLIESGKILFAVDAQPYLMGYLGVSFLYLHKINGNEVGGGEPVYSGPGYVTKDNVAAVAGFAKNGTR
ncbi:MAG: sugar ABC transporter substrate-binding protein [Actinomycetes bacterium]